jgi:hypothetical protein
MEGIILEGISIGMAVVGVLIRGAGVTGVFLLWMSEEEKVGASFTWAGWPLPETKEPALPEEEEEAVRRAA